MSLPKEIAAAVASEGMNGAAIELISPLGERKGRRLCYLASAEGRDAIKLRLLETHEAAAELERLSNGLGPPFAVVLRRHGRVVVEPWIEGVELSADVARQWIEPAAAILGGLHARELDRDVLDDCSISRWLRSARIDLQTIRAAGLVETEVAERLGATIERLERRPAPIAVIHRDFCVENLIVDGDGALWVIDNEWMIAGPAAFDLGRTFQRWPMTEDEWQRFVKAYSTVAGEPRDLELWMQVAALFAARVAHQLVPGQLPRALEMLGAEGP